MMDEVAPRDEEGKTHGIGGIEDGQTHSASAGNPSSLSTGADWGRVG